MRTYLFYDIETSGLNHCFDQILQFAAIRTDDRLHPQQQYELRIRLQPDVIPSPGALTTCRVTLEDIQAGYDEYSAMRQIHAWLNEPGTLSLGYNTLSFDDLFLRFSFYRNLLPAYTHQWKDGCARADLFPLMALYYLYRPNLFTWPTVNDKVSLKLEHLASANGLDDGQAHDAMVDVAATVRLAQRMAQDSALWQTGFRLFDKDYDADSLAHLPTRRLGHAAYPIGVLVEGSFGARRDFRAPALMLGPIERQTKQTHWLRLDDARLQSLEPGQPGGFLVINKKLGELPFVLALNAPEMFSAERHALIEDNLAWLASHPAILDSLTAQHTATVYTERPNLDPYAALYQVGFPNRREEMLAQEFHAASWPTKARLIPQFTGVYQELARRLVGNHAPEVLSAEEAERYQAYLASAWRAPDAAERVDYKGQPKLTPTAALAELTKHRAANLDDEQQQILTGLESFLRAGCASYI